MQNSTVCTLKLAKEPFLIQTPFNILMVSLEKQPCELSAISPLKWLVCSDLTTE